MKTLNIQRPNCPRCDATKALKAGQPNGKQRWKCYKCQYEFTKPELHGRSTQFKMQVVGQYESGLSSNKLAKLASVSPASVLRWSRQFNPYPWSRANQRKRIWLPRKIRLLLRSLEYEWPI